MSGWPKSVWNCIRLELHPDKTKIVYCKDSNRRGDFEHTSFTFLGFTFRPRQARRKDGIRFTSFLPAISKEALKKIGERLRSWRLHRFTGCTGSPAAQVHRLHRFTGSTVADIARMVNPVVRGWMTYYGVFYRTARVPSTARRCIPCSTASTPPCCGGS
ncbi:MAG: group II intron maturase-specific domain-containing protein [Dermatophilaceae bacterium]